MRPLTIVGGVREASSVWGRGTREKLWARGPCPTWVPGPSTSPLEVTNRARARPMHNTPDRVWFALGGLVALWVALKPDQFIRVASYGRARVTDIAPFLVNALRIIAAVVVIATVVAFLLGAWSVS